jgi:hypothetical protein
MAMPILPSADIFVARKILSSEPRPDTPDACGFIFIILLRLVPNVAVVDSYLLQAYFIKKHLSTADFLPDKIPCRRGMRRWRR